jgi:hypothetical protein
LPFVYAGFQLSVLVFWREGVAGWGGSRLGKKTTFQVSDLPGRGPGRSENYPFCRFFLTHSRSAAEAVWEKHQPSRSATWKVEKKYNIFNIAHFRFNKYY